MRGIWKTTDVANPDHFIDSSGGQDRRSPAIRNGHDHRAYNILSTITIFYTGDI